MGPRDIGEAVGVTGHIWRTEQKKIQMNGVSFPALASKQTHTQTHTGLNVGLLEKQKGGEGRSIGLKDDIIPSVFLLLHSPSLPPSFTTPPIGLSSSSPPR